MALGRSEDGPPEGFGSDRALITIAFGHSRSSAYENAVKIAACAERYTVRDGTHFAEFSPDLTQARLAVQLYTLVSGWRGSLSFASGRPILEPSEAWETLACFARSFDSPDPVDHCEKVVHFIGRPGELSNPTQKIKLNCQRLERWLDMQIPGVELVKRLPAVAARAECTWCPRIAGRPHAIMLLPNESQNER